MKELLFNARRAGKNTGLKESMIEIDGVIGECQKCQSKKLLSVSYRISGEGCTFGVKCADCGQLYIGKK